MKFGVQNSGHRFDVRSAYLIVRRGGDITQSPGNFGIFAAHRAPVATTVAKVLRNRADQVGRPSIVPGIKRNTQRAVAKPAIEVLAVAGFPGAIRLDEHGPGARGIDPFPDGLGYELRADILTGLVRTIAHNDEWSRCLWTDVKGAAITRLWPSFTSTTRP